MAVHVMTTDAGWTMALKRETVNLTYVMNDHINVENPSSLTMTPPQEYNNVHINRLLVCTTTWRRILSGLSVTRCSWRVTANCTNTQAKMANKQPSRQDRARERVECQRTADARQDMCAGGKGQSRDVVMATTRAFTILYCALS
ncbi:hypothetical protein J6590_006967 [Homalodisca vitripennis]|nr:hypothetical protein J6590_006967 [Homalodisca vitripennis]